MIAWEGGSDSHSYGEEGKKELWVPQMGHADGVGC